MHRATYDTRFFVELFYGTNEAMRRKIGDEKKRSERCVSSVVLHETYRLSLSRDGRSTARLRVAMIKKDFQIVPVDEHVAVASAELRKKYNLSMGDSMIAATACVLDAICISDDPHLQRVKEIETVWL